MYWAHGVLDHLHFPSVVVNDLHLLRVLSIPDKANAERVVDADAVLPLIVALERLQAITGRRAQIAQLGCRSQMPQLANGDSGYGRKPTRPDAFDECLRFGGGKSEGHLDSI